MKNEFLNRVDSLIEENISNEQYGVSELAAEVGMSRSNLLRKIKKLTELSASQYIRKVRLENAMKMLKETSMTASEVSYKVGFNSTSYFIKCFHDHFGFPPGKVRETVNSEIETKQAEKTEKNNPGKTKRTDFKKYRTELIGILLVLFVVVIGYFLIPQDFINLSGNTPVIRNDSDATKSVAVLPFINDSNDSTNVYIINGLMESLLNNLQKVEGLRVISRTSMEKYRRLEKSIPEIAKELNVRYFVEGSGQKIGDQILLSIQLIEGSTDRHLWGEQYKREANDIFNLQNEVAKNITSEIQVFISPEEEKRIEKKPTENLLAYDFFLKGRELMEESTPGSIEKAIIILKKAIEEDPEFARAYAAIAISFYFLDYYESEKIYIDSINFYADKALFYDSDIAQSLIAKGLYYLNIEEYKQAISYFERTLEIHPGNDLVYIFLIDLYANHFPDSEKYLIYALRGLQIDVVAAYDSTTASYSYLHISNALIQNGFTDEAEKYINRSLDYFPGNIYSQYVKAYILYAKNNKLEKTNKLLLEVLEKDSTRLDVLQEVGKIYYYMRDYQSAYKYYQKFLAIRTAYNLDIFHSEDAKIAYVLDKVGLKEKSKKMLNEFKLYAENDPSIYKNVNLAMYYSYQNDKQKALENLEYFSEESNFHYWTILFVAQDPLMDNLKNLPEFKKLWRSIEEKFRLQHKKMENYLKSENLI